MMESDIGTIDITADYIRGILNYDASSGALTWRLPRSKNIHEGSRADCFDSKGYTRVRINGKYMKAHRLAWIHVYGQWPEGHLDHANGVRNDNRICNLRLANFQQNARNFKKMNDGKAPYKGITYNKSSRKWQAQLGGVERKYLGVFLNPDDAARAYDKAATDAYGEFARTNLMMGLLK